jgi:hypothetical protein
MLERVKQWIANWLIRRYLKRTTKVTDPIAAKNAQIASLEQQIATLRAMQVSNPTVSLADQLAAIQKQPVPPLVTPSLVEQLITPVIPSVPPIIPVPPVEPISAQELQQEPQLAAPEPQPEPAMSTPPQEAPAAAPKSTGSTLPDVKLLAPILKIAMASLSVEQMIEIGLHVKMGAPGFQQFLESEVARTKFKELYATYCDFLAGKVK